MVKRKLLAGMTHAIVRHTSKKDADDNHIFAFVDLCFGPGDDDRIVAIPFEQVAKKQYVFHAPNTVFLCQGKKTKTPVFTGQLGREICEACQSAMDLVRQKTGGYRHNKSYRVTEKTVVELEKAA